ncbi:MAG: MATE family efflux transporter [Succinivibrionaceae bacterium]|nr:MATE family efflux transporter [Succinivibrionaceae bacterium]
MSVPAIMAQIASVCMQYIDASMVGQLGADDSASIGLVSSSIWLLCSIGMAVNVGFTVLMAQKIGARKYVSARNLLKLAFLVCLAASLLLAGAGILVSDILPVWLGGNSEINRGASEYFLIFTSALPVLILNALSSGMLQSSGNMKLPSLLNMLMCLLDVVFNYLLIFPSREISFGGFSLVIPGCDLGIRGAALGTVAAETVTFALMLFFLLFRTPQLQLHREEKFIFSSRLVRRAFLISLPVGFDHIAMCLAMVVSMMIVAPLGTVPIATHSFAITAESFCYMAGYGIAAAATTMVGQSIGARRADLAVSFAWLVTGLGVSIMTAAGILMFIFAPLMMGLLSPVAEIRNLGAEVLRIEAFAEPLFGASIVAAGALRGAGDTFFPSLINFISMWFVRIPLSLLLATYYGFYGIWVAMCIELCIRGLLFLYRLKRGKWLKNI